LRKRQTHERPSSVVFSLSDLPSSAAPRSSMPSPRSDSNRTLLFLRRAPAIAAVAYLRVGVVGGCKWVGQGEWVRWQGGWVENSKIISGIVSRGSGETRVVESAEVLMLNE